MDNKGLEVLVLKLYVFDVRLLLRPALVRVCLLALLAIGDIGIVQGAKEERVLGRRCWSRLLWRVMSYGTLRQGLNYQYRTLSILTRRMYPYLVSYQGLELMNELPSSYHTIVTDDMV